MNKIRKPKFTLPELRRSWLVQRLNAPYEGMFGSSPTTPFSFGGGLLNGGLSSDALDLFRGVFVFDYMGAAEFEFGAVPEAFQKIAEFAYAGVLSAWSFGVDMGTVKTFRGKGTAGETAIVYAIAPTAWSSDVEDRVREWATGINNLKEQTRLSGALLGEEYNDTRGWLELDNGFMFFVDEDMWKSMCTLFGVE